MSSDSPHPFREALQSHLEPVSGRCVWKACCHRQWQWNADAAPLRLASMIGHIVGKLIKWGGRSVGALSVSEARRALDLSSNTRRPVAHYVDRWCFTSSLHSSFHSSSFFFSRKRSRNIEEPVLDTWPSFPSLSSIWNAVVCVRAWLSQFTVHQLATPWYNSEPRSIFNFKHLLHFHQLIFEGLVLEFWVRSRPLITSFTRRTGRATIRPPVP